MNVLTDRQKRFCREYGVDFNGTQAAVRAGYSPRTANEQAARLLAKVSVKDRIDELARAAATRNDVTVDGVIATLVRLRDKAEDLGQMGPAVRAEELRGKYLGMFIDRTKVEGSVSEMSDTQLAAEMARAGSGGDPVLERKIVGNMLNEMGWKDGVGPTGASS